MHTNENRKYLCEVKEVMSGDDLLLLVDLGVDGLYKKVRARLKGTDTPDAYKSKPDTEAGRVRDWVRELSGSDECVLELCAVRKGGWIVILWPNKDTSKDSINSILQKHGYIKRERNDEKS